MRISTAGHLVVHAVLWRGPTELLAAWHPPRPLLDAIERIATIVAAG